MASLIQGYGYDIFISYRQKDNKHDGWVTEFVDNLKGELESTFKEEIGVYFDINPNDGLLDTHDVDASLKEKLKCLVFIPIISQTYCDSKSFAWQNEFVAFNKLVKEDQFGRDIRLSNGNVTSRILPVKIHDLDPEDKTLLENELGGVLRGIEFIYKSAGVNRPLRANEDHPQDNLNKTYYRDQINKVANAVKEIISVLKKPGRQEREVQGKIVKEKPEKSRNLRTKIFTGTFLALALIVLGYFIIPKLFKSFEQVEKSIAVLPFKLLSDEPDKQYLADGMMDAILMHLQKFKDLKVLSRTSVEQYHGTTKSILAISHELNVGYILEGSFQKHGDNVKLMVQLIKGDEDSHAWANEYNIEWKDIFSVQSEVAKSIAGELHTTISPEEKALIEKIPTSNLAAYDLYMKALDFDKDFEKTNNMNSYNKALTLYGASIEIDSTFAKAYIGLARIYSNRYYWETYFKETFLDTCLALVNKALSFDDQQEEAYYIKGVYYAEKGNTEIALENLNKALQINPNYYPAYRIKGVGLTSIMHDYIGGIDNYTKALTLIRGNERPGLLRLLGRAYLDVGFVEKARSLYAEAYSLDGRKASHYGNLSWLEFSSGNFEEALKLSKMAKEIDTTYLTDLFIYIINPDHKDDAYIHAKEIIDCNKSRGSLSLYQSHRIGYAFYNVGRTKEAESYFKQQINYSQDNIKLGRTFAQRLAAQYDLAATYAFLGEKEKAYKYLDEFDKLDFYQLWWLSMTKNDPFFAGIRNEERFKKILQNMESKYQAEHERVRKWLEENGLANEVS